MSAHSCFVCREDNPERIVTRNDNGWTFNFIERFVGPPGTVHGGMAVGALSCPALDIASREGMKNPVVLSSSGRIKMPLPLSKPMGTMASLKGNDCEVKLYHDGRVLLDGMVGLADIDAEPGEILQPLPAEFEDDLRQMAELADIKTEDTIVTEQFKADAQSPDDKESAWICFGCSGSETALKIRHRMAKPGFIWTPWEVEPGFTDTDETLAAVVIAASLDCGTVHSASADDPKFMADLTKNKQLAVTGTFGIRYFRLPPLNIDGGYRVVAKYLSRDGRKISAISALLDKRGNVYAMGEAIILLINFPS